MTASVALSTVLTALPAAAQDSGEFSDTGLSLGDVLLRFVLLPLGLLLGIALLAAIPRLLRRPRYRPGRPWNFDPVWFAGPDDPDGTLALARPQRGLGGASADW